MENETFYCEYLHSGHTKAGLWVDGPITCIAATFSAIGTCYAIRFLRYASLNKRMSAALYTLCFIDFMLMLTTVLFLSIEANSMLLLSFNYLYNKQRMILVLYGIRNSFVLSSTTLVIYITYIRYKVVSNPFQYVPDYSTVRKSFGKMSSVTQPSTDSTKIVVSFTTELHLEFHSNRNLRCLHFLRNLQPFAVPVLLVFICFVAHCPSYFEFVMVPCFDRFYKDFSTMLMPTSMRLSEKYIKAKAVFTVMTETVGPMLIISILSLVTEYAIHTNAINRRRLFENQKRSIDVLITEELKDKASKALAVFIVVKFLILRSLPTIIDLYELTIENSNNFGEFMTFLTRLSDFLVVFNSATNTLAYFGKKRFEKWLERRIRGRIHRKESRILRRSFTA